MSKMVYLPYVRFEQEEGEAEGIGWYFTQYNAETGEGRGWHGTEFMPDCFFETKCEGGEPETKFFDVNTNEPIKQWSWPEPPDDNAFTNYGSLDEFVANNSQKVFRVVDRNKEAQDCPCMIYGRLSSAGAPIFAGRRGLSAPHRWKLPRMLPFRNRKAAVSCGRRYTHCRTISESRCGCTMWRATAQRRSRKWSAAVRQRYARGCIAQESN